MQLFKMKDVAVAISALALCVSPTGAIAAPTASYRPVAINPLVALSALGSPASRTALCGSSAAAAAGTVVAGQGVPGCLLPLADLPPPVPVAETALPPVLEAAPMAATGGFYAIPPLLLGLVGIVLGAVLLHALDDDDEEVEDNSPS
jgi:hypothetical protein